MSTEANAALAWPIEITEFAYIGDQVAEELWVQDAGKDDQVQPFGAYVWVVGAEDTPLFSLLGCADPGDLWAHLDRTSDRITREFAELYADAGFYTPPGMPTPAPRRCVGDPSMDPTVLEEGCWVPWLVPAPLWDSVDDPGEIVGCDGSRKGNQDG
jgi:hypothetical protein